METQVQLDVALPTEAALACAPLENATVGVGLRGERVVQVLSHVLGLDDGPRHRRAQAPIAVESLVLVGNARPAARLCGTSGGLPRPRGPRAFPGRARPARLGLPGPPPPGSASPRGPDPTGGAVLHAAKARA